MLQRQLTMYTAVSTRAPVSQVAFAFQVTPQLLIMGLSYALIMGLIGRIVPGFAGRPHPYPLCAERVMSERRLGPGLARLRQVRMRNLGLIGALVIAFFPRPAQAQGDAMKDKIAHLIQKAGIYVSVSRKDASDSDVRISQGVGISPGLAGSQRKGKKYPFSFSTYSADLETGGATFGNFKAKQIMSGIGYQWAPTPKLVYSTQLNVGYSFNSIDAISPETAFAASGPVQVSVSNSWVLRPQAKIEYYVRRKMSVRLQGGYLYTNPHVTVHTPTTRFENDWRPSHFYASLGMGLFPFRK